jgi:putative DNA primase/helicase
MSVAGHAGPDTPLDAALAYVSRGWPVVPFAERNGRKFPLTEHGFTDATLDANFILEWWWRWPSALAAIATGKASRVIALDIDVRPDGSGLDTLEELGHPFHPVTPTAHTPRGGVHCLFSWPGFEVPSSAGKIGRLLDIRGDGGALILPPGPTRYWDPHLGLDTPLAPLPAWILFAVKPREPTLPRSTNCPLGALPPYGEAALDSAVERIVSAPNGEQHFTLNRECFAIGGLAAGGAIPSALALEALQWAAQQMPSHDWRRPWRHQELVRQVERSFLDGLAHPREVRP